MTDDDLLDRELNARVVSPCLAEYFRWFAVSGLGAVNDPEKFRVWRAAWEASARVIDDATSRG